MVFSSLTFICIFLPVVFLACFVLPTVRLKNYLLILASLLFYAFGEPVYVLLMIVSSVLNYALARAIGSKQSNSHGQRKALVILAVVVNLSFLGVFKYASMFVSSVDTLFNLSWEVPVIALPIGISFYTFQALSYVIDVYKEKVEAATSFSKVLLYISFFPQLIAGPIIQYRDVEEQLANRSMTLDGVARGLRRFAVGLGKKVLIANTMAVVVDAIYGADMGEVGMAAAWLAAFAYLMQIYFDFSGYSDMAIGMAQAFGFRYKENFNYPYISSSIQEFWRRWHISLSNWFKEYLYIPLGGNRKGRLRAGLNKVVVFFFCGLWHGASWTFVVWGLFHGFFLLLESLLPIKRLPKVLGVVYTLLVVIVGFVLFRAESFEQAAYFISQMFTGFSSVSAASALALEQLTLLFIVTCIVAIIACLPLRNFFTHKWGLFAVPTQAAQEQASTQAVQRHVPDQALQEQTASQAAQEHMSTQTTQEQASTTKAASFISGSSYVLALVLLFVCLLSLSGGGYNPFIYFRF